MHCNRVEFVEDPILTRAIYRNWHGKTWTNFFVLEARKGNERDQSKWYNSNGTKAMQHSVAIKYHATASLAVESCFALNESAIELFRFCRCAFELKVKITQKYHINLSMFSRIKCKIILSFFYVNKILDLNKKHKFSLKTIILICKNDKIEFLYSANKTHTLDARVISRIPIEFIQVGIQYESTSERCDLKLDLREREVL